MNRTHIMDQPSFQARLNSPDRSDEPPRPRQPNEHRRGAALVLALVLVMVIGVAVSTLMLTLRHRADRTLQHQWNTQAELIALAVHQSGRMPVSIALGDTTSPEWSGVTVAVLNDRVELRRGEVLLAASPITPNTAAAANRNEVSE